MKVEYIILQVKQIIKIISDQLAKENKELENKLNELEELAKKVTTWSLYFYKYGNTSIKNNKRKKAIF